MGSLGDQPFRVIFAAALDAMVVSDAQGHLLEVNAAASELLGSPMEALVGQTWGSLVSSPQQLSGLLGLLVAGESGRGELELTGEGVSKTVEYSLSAASEGSHALLILRDATERIQREKGLLADQQMFQTLFEILPVGVAITDATGNLIKVNPASERILGLSISEQLDRTYDAPDWQIIYPDGSPMPAEEFASVKALQQQRPIFGEEKGILHPNGEIAWIEVNAAPIPLKGYGVVITYIDRTKRKAAELELQNSELRMRQIVEAIDVIFFIKSADNHRALYVSPAYEKIWGRTCESFYQDPNSWKDGIHPDDRDALMKIVDQDLNLTSPTTSKEYRIVRPDGSYIWVADSIAPILGKTGKVEYITGIVLDITARKEAELVRLQQAEREHLLRTLTHHIRQSLDIDQILLRAVEGVRHLLGADRVVICRIEEYSNSDTVTESVGIGWPALQGSHIQNPCFREIWGKPYCPEIFIAIDDTQQLDLSAADRKLLKIFNILAHLEVPIVIDNAVWGLLCVHHCGSHHKWQDWEIHLLQNIADQLAIAIHQSNLLQQSQIWAAILERKVEERTADLNQALGFESTLRYITDQVRSSLDEAQILQAVVESLGQGINADGCYVSHYHKDGVNYTIDYEWTSVHPSIKGRTYTSNLNFQDHPYRNQGTQYCFNHLDAGWVTVASFVILLDPGIPYGFMTLARPKTSVFSPSEVRLAEQVASQCSIAIRQARLYQDSQVQVQKLQELNRLKQDFVDTISHELRTPLTSMKLAITMLERFQHNPKKQERYLTILKSEWNRELDLVNGLLELQSLESGSKIYTLSMVDISSWVSLIVEPFMLRCEQHQQLFQVEWDPEIKTLYTDLYLLDRILTELLNNACKYTPSHQSIRLTISKIEQGIRLQLTNTGVTIPADQLSHIFEKFYRVPSLDHFNQGGTGLGLALVQKMVALLGGVIAAESADNVTTFRIDLSSAKILSNS